MNKDWELALLEAGIDIPKGKTEFNILCPWHDDGSPSLSMNTIKGVWICQAGCGEGKIVSFLARYLGISRFEADQLAFIPPDDYEDLNLFPEFNVAENDEELLPLPIIEQTYDASRVPRMALDRGFTPKVLKDWGCGLDLATGALVIPVYDEFGRFVSENRRQPQGWKPKYHIPPDFQKRRVLFGFNRIDIETPIVCITEGVLDTIWLAQHGIPAVALFGVTLTEYHIALLKTLPRLKEIILCLDNDERGKTMAQKSFTLLQKRYILSILNLPEEYKDVQEVRIPEVLKEAINSRLYF